MFLGFSFLLVLVCGTWRCTRRCCCFFSFRAVRFECVCLLVASSAMRLAQQRPCVAQKIGGPSRHVPREVVAMVERPRAGWTTQINECVYSTANASEQRGNNAGACMTHGVSKHVDMTRNQNRNGTRGHLSQNTRPRAHAHTHTDTAVPSSRHPFGYSLPWNLVAGAVSSWRQVGASQRRGCTAA